MLRPGFGRRAREEAKPARAPSFREAMEGCCPHGKFSRPLRSVQFPAEHAGPKAARGGTCKEVEAATEARARFAGKLRKTHTFPEVLRGFEKIEVSFGDVG